MTATTELITGVVPRADRAALDAYAATVAVATDAQLDAWAAYHRHNIAKARAHGEPPTGHVLCLSVVEDEQDARYFTPSTRSTP